MSRLLCSKYGFNILRSGDGYIVHNTNKPFKEGHTHLTNFQSAKDAVRFSLEHRVPMKANTYFIISLIRINKDPEYLKKLNQRLQELRQFGRYYDNNSIKEDFKWQEQGERM